MINIDEEIQLLIEKLREEYKIPGYAYSKNDKFIPGVTPVYYSGPYFDDKEVIASVKSMLTGKWMTAGESVHEFEKAFSRKMKVLHSCMTNSGSSANLVMLAALKKFYAWKDDSEIIVSVVGFPTTISVISQNNLVPVFVDIELDTLNFNIELIEEKITDKTKAILVSPVLGNLSDMDELVSLCSYYKLKLVLDNCDSLGSKWRDRYYNEYADISSCSFYASHELCTFEGGMVSSNNNGLMNIVRSLINWGRECFPINTKIYTSNKIKEIQDIAIGDYVFTHAGNLKKVTALFNQKYTGKMIEVFCKKRKSIKSTKNHPYLVLRTKGYDLSKLSKKDIFPNPEWVNADKIIKGDYLLERVPDEVICIENIYVKYLTDYGEKEFSLPFEKELLRLSGYWVSQGSLAKGSKGSNGTKDKADRTKIYYKYRVEFTFNINDEIEIQETKELMKKYFGISNCYEKKQGGGISLSFTSRKSYEYFNQQFGTISYKKSMPEKFIYAQKDIMLQFLLGFWRGDGSKWKGSKTRKANYSFSTTSETLCYQIKRLLLTQEISPNICIRNPEKHKSNIVNGRSVIAKHKLYNIVIYGEGAKKLTKLFERTEDNYSDKKHYYFTSDKKYALYKVNNVKEEYVKNVDVYNFAVDDDNSYHADGLAVHNCTCSGIENLLPNGICNNRFSNWLEGYEGIIDHKYVFNNIGYNLKPLDVCGAVGLVQLDKFDEICAYRKINKVIICNMFEKRIKGVKIPQRNVLSDTVWFGSPIICASKELKQKLVRYLENNKIQTRNYFAGNILLHPGYRHLGDYKKYPNANEVLDRVFFVGASPSYNSDIFNYIEDVLMGFNNV